MEADRIKVNGACLGSQKKVEIRARIAGLVAKRRMLVDQWRIAGPGSLEWADAVCQEVEDAESKVKALMLELGYEGWFWQAAELEAFKV